MTKFKVGDVVERNRVWEGNGLPSGKLGVVSSVAGKFVYVKGYRGWAHLEETLRLVEQGDPLPPAPESVRYYTVPSKTQYLDILPNEFGEVEIRSILPDFASYNYLTPDAALQLAHDLTRMAMEIKRRERAQSGE